jgi:hypothetical protein
MPVVLPFLFVGFLVWIICLRVRSNIGRQPVRPRLIRTYLFWGIVFTLLVIRFSFQSQNQALAIGAGLLLGAALGRFGWRLTKFEETPEGHFYTPDTRIGISLLLLFMGRLMYRLWLLRQSGRVSGVQALRNPLTLFIFGLIAGYYIVYYSGLFMYTREKAIPVKRAFFDWLRSKSNTSR